MDKTMMTTFLNKMRMLSLGVVAASALSLSVSTSFAGERPFGFAVSGVVSEIAVQEGQTVANGAVLARLEAIVFEANVKAAQAVVEMTENQLTRSEEDLVVTQQLYDDLSASGEQLKDAEHTVSLSIAELEAANARLIAATWALKKATLVAPKGGTVTSIPGFVGQAVDPSSPQAVVIVD